MRLQEVDGLHAKPTQTAFGGLSDVGGTQVSAAHLGRQEDLVARTRPGGQRAADNLFGRVIGLRGIDESHALLESVVERLDRVALVDGAHAAADRPRTEANDWDRRTISAKLALLHAEVPPARYQAA